ALMVTICAFALAALIWSCVGRLDVHAVASGKIETAGYSKVIEPLDPGKVAAIHVEAGQSGKGGGPPVGRRPAQASADAIAAQDALDASLAEIARRRFAIDAVRSAQETEVPRSGDRDDAAAMRGKGPPDGSEERQASALSPVEELAGRPELTIAWDK